MISSDCGETQADFSEVFPDLEGEEERSGDFYNTPASPITVPYCPRPPSTGTALSLNLQNYNLIEINMKAHKNLHDQDDNARHRLTNRTKKLQPNRLSELNIERYTQPVGRHGTTAQGNKWSRSL